MTKCPYCPMPNDVHHHGCCLRPKDKNHQNSTSDDPIGAALAAADRRQTPVVVRSFTLSDALMELVLACPRCVDRPHELRALCEEHELTAAKEILAKKAPQLIGALAFDDEIDRLCGALPKEAIERIKGMNMSTSTSAAHEVVSQAIMLINQLLIDQHRKGLRTVQMFDEVEQHEPYANRRDRIACGCDICMEIEK